MELKLLNNVLKTVNLNKFKLYLYGIEIMNYRIMQEQNRFVQIVPLWNWNNQRKKYKA